MFGGDKFQNCPILKFLIHFWKFKIEFLEKYPIEWAVPSVYVRLVRDLQCARFSDKTEIVAEIIGWFYMELLDEEIPILLIPILICILPSWD